MKPTKIIAGAGNQSQEAAFQAFLRHIRFWETREGWPHLDEALLRGLYRQMSFRAARRAEATQKSATYPELVPQEPKGEKPSLPRWPGPSPIRALKQPPSPVTYRPGSVPLP